MPITFGAMENHAVAQKVASNALIRALAVTSRAEIARWCNDAGINTRRQDVYRWERHISPIPAECVSVIEDNLRRVAKIALGAG